MLLLATVAWLVWVLAGVADWPTAWTVAGLTIAAVFLANGRVWRIRGIAGGAAVWLALVGALLAPVTLEAAAPSARSVAAREDGSGWIAFDRSEIARAVSVGKVVFVDVTADWCLTCKANKATTLDREPVRSHAGRGERHRNAGRLDASERGYRPLPEGERTLRDPVQRGVRSGRARGDRSVGAVIDPSPSPMRSTRLAGRWIARAKRRGTNPELALPNDHICDGARGR